MIRAFATTMGCLIGLLVLAAGAGSALRGMGAVSVSAAGFAKPVDGAQITQPFGCTAFSAEPVDPSCPSGHFHSGVDLATPTGRPVRATQSGTAHVVESATGYGLHVVIDHADVVSSLYGHLSHVDIADGETVAQGAQIGEVGSTGNSTGPHLHFEIRRGGVPVDPQQLLALP